MEVGKQYVVYLKPIQCYMAVISQFKIEYGHDCLKRVSFREMNMIALLQCIKNKQTNQKTPKYMGGGDV